MVMDAEIVFKGITEWMFKWRRHGWVGAAGPVGHSDLWQQIYILTLMHGDTLSFQWVPSHIGIEGNEQADRLAELGRLQHPHNATQVQKRRCLAEGRAVWLGLGLEEMLSDFGTSSGGEASSPTDTESNDTPPRGVGAGRGVGMDAADESGGYMAAGNGHETCSSTTESWGSDSTSSLCDSDASIVVPVVYDSSTVSPSTDVSEGNRARRARARKFRKK